MSHPLFELSKLTVTQARLSCYGSCSVAKGVGHFLGGAQTDLLGSALTFVRLLGRASFSRSREPCMDTIIEAVTRGWGDFITRTSGPMHFRFFCQPAMAALL